MATRTSTKSGDWSSAGTWDSGVPADGDDVVIASGHTVTFDVDQSAFSTGVKITITGTLTHTTAAGSYCLYIKTGASVVGAGTWNVGTSATPIPFSSKHLITGAAGWYVDGNDGLSLNVYGAEPEYKYIKLSDAEAAGQTELSVDTDVTGDIWAAGDLITICNINKGKNAEERTIAAAGITSTTITVTSGLTGAKLKGSVICLLTRNIRFIANWGAANQCLYRIGNTANKLNIGSGMFYAASVSYKIFFSICNYMNINGGVITGGQYWAMNGCQYPTISNCVFTNNNYSTSSLTNPIITDNIFVGNTYDIATGGYYVAKNNIHYGCLIPAMNLVSPLIDGDSCTGCNSVFYSNTMMSVTNVTIENCETGFDSTTGKFNNMTFGVTTAHNNYKTTTPFCYNTQSENHGGVEGAMKAWCRGGTVTSQDSVLPTGYSLGYLLTLESADTPVFFSRSFTVPAGSKITVEVKLRKSASMSYKPRACLMKANENPLLGTTPQDSFVMSDSVDTWETDSFEIDNSAGTNDKEYALWFVAQNANGNAYGAYKLIPPAGGGLLTNPGMTGGIRG